MASFISFSLCSITDTKIERIMAVIDDETYGLIFQFISLKNLDSSSFVKLLYLGQGGVFLEITNENDSPTPCTPIHISRNGILSLKS